MEGPYVQEKIRIGDVIASKSVIIPESMVLFVENRDKVGSAGPSMSSAGSQPSGNGKPVGLLNTSGARRELYWLKRIRIDVLDENDKPLPTAEFICHMNLDVDPAFRNKVFPEGERCNNGRLMTLTQGQTDFSFPDGFGVPVASDETWMFSFQAANRTTDQHRRIKHRFTMWFIKDSNLLYPIKALNWYVPYICVIVDRNSQAEESAHDGPDCSITSSGVTAPNSVKTSVFSDSHGRKLVGHWVVPPGLQVYKTPLTEERDPGFADENRKIHAVWTHIHPLCKTCSLYRCDGKDRKPIFTARVQTDTKHGLEIKHIDNIISREGILLPKNEHYELEAVYDNTTGVPLDSMVTLGVFCEDKKFARPDWFIEDKNVAFCGVAAPTLTLTGKGCAVTSSESASASSNTTTQVAPAPAVSSGGEYPLFDANRDGPVLTDSKVIDLETTAGDIHLMLDPSLAPMHATQIYKLLKGGAFDGTGFYQYVPNYLLQVAAAGNKAEGQPPLSSEALSMFRYLPLEASSQTGGPVIHKKWALSMTRFEQKNSAVSSFSIMLTEAPNLDHNYTVFGRVIPDGTTVTTIQNIIKNWTTSRPWILRAKEL
jgi:cyclophilin family peptidyl-prolyl cis-trans isomerase